MAFVNNNLAKVLQDKVKSDLNPIQFPNNILGNYLSIYGSFLVHHHGLISKSGSCTS